MKDEKFCSWARDLYTDFLINAKINRSMMDKLLYVSVDAACRKNWTCTHLKYEIERNTKNLSSCIKDYLRTDLIRFIV